MHSVNVYACACSAATFAILFAIDPSSVVNFTPAIAWVYVELPSDVHLACSSASLLPHPDNVIKPTINADTLIFEFDITIRYFVVVEGMFIT